VPCLPSQALPALASLRPTEPGQMPSRARLHTIVSLLDGKIVRFFRRFLPLLAAKWLKFQLDSCNDLDSNVLSKTSAWAHDLPYPE
jgi:hypothetical protein